MKYIARAFVLLLCLTALLSSLSCTATENTPTDTTPGDETNDTILESVASVSLPIQNHWTESDINDGQTVYVDLSNVRNEYIGPAAGVGIVKVTLTVKGLAPQSADNYTVMLYEKTFDNLDYSDITYPNGSGIVVLFSELAEYDQECCTAIWAEVVLSDGRVVKTHDPYDFETEPVHYQVPKWVDEVERAWTVGHPENWDADAEDDGIRVWVELQDSDEEMIEYSDMSMPALVEIYSTESATYPLEKARVIYSGSGTLTDWEHDCFCTGAGGVIDIPWEAIASRLPAEDQESGILYVTITLPNAKQHSAQYDPMEIKAS